MAKLSRRALFPLAAAGIIPAADGSQGANLNPFEGTIQIKIAKDRDNGWSVLVPDFDAMNNNWSPRMIMPVKWVPILEYLALIDETYRKDA